MQFIISLGAHENDDNDDGNNNEYDELWSAHTAYIPYCKEHTICTPSPQSSWGPHYTYKIYPDPQHPEYGKDYQPNVVFVAVVVHVELFSSASLLLAIFLIFSEYSLGGQYSKSVYTLLVCGATTYLPKHTHTPHCSAIMRANVDFGTYRRRHQRKRNQPFHVCVCVCVFG